MAASAWQSPVCWCSRESPQGDIRTGVLVTVGAALAGMAFGRLVAAAFGDRTGFYPNWFYCLVEIIAAAALFSVAVGR